MHDEMSADKSEWSYMQTTSAGFRKRECMRVCEASHHNGDRLWKNSVMHVPTVWCKRKLKRCFYKLTNVKMKKSTHWNQSNNTHKKRNTKSGINIMQDMKRGFTPKQLRLMFMTTGWNASCQRYKFDVINELCSVRLMIFYKIEAAMCMPQI